MKKKVLIPLDGSDFSKSILPCIEKFFEPEETELILFHLTEEPEAVHVREGSIHIDIYVDQAEASICEQLKTKLRDQVKMLEGAGFVTRVEIRFNHAPAKKIVAFVQREEVDLVAMTTHGRTGLRRVLTGSVAEYVLRHVNVPVLLLRPFAASAERTGAVEEQEAMLMT